MIHPFVFGRLLTLQSVFFNRKKKRTFFARFNLPTEMFTKTLRSPGGRCSWGAIVCLLQLEAHDRMRSASISERQTAARSQKQIPGPESRMVKFVKFGIFAVSIKESIVDIWFVDKLRSIEFDWVVIQILTPLMGNIIFLGGNPSRHLPRAFAIRMYSADSSMPFQICTHSSRQRQACPLWWSDFFVVFWTKKRRQL